MSYEEKVKKVKNYLKDYPNVKLVAATKYLTVEQTENLLKAGIKAVGENRTDMFLEKYKVLNDKYDVEWHFFGNLQSRKIRDVVDKIDCLHSLCKISTAMELDKRLERTLDVYIEVNISDEPNKDGVPASKAKMFIKQLAKCKHLRVIGLMCIAKRTYDNKIVEMEFSRMQRLQKDIEAMELPYAPCHGLSMGMSDDYKIALKYGTTCVRLGRAFLD